MSASGIDAILKMNEKARLALVGAAGAGLYAAASRVMTTTKDGLVPVDKGALTNSGYVTLPEASGEVVELESGFGGPAQDYAVVQHEEQSFQHEVGTHKFFEKGIQQEASEIPRIVAEYGAKALANNAQVPAAPRTGQPAGPWEAHNAKIERQKKAQENRRKKNLAKAKSKVRFR